MVKNLKAGGIALIALMAHSGCGLFAPIFGPVSQTTTSNVDQNKDEGYIRFSNLGPDSEIYIDGHMVGNGRAYQGGGQLGVSPGSHEIEIRDSGLLRFKQKIFVGTGSTRMVDVR